MVPTASCPFSRVRARFFNLAISKKIEARDTKAREVLRGAVDQRRVAVVVDDEAPRRQLAELGRQRPRDAAHLRDEERRVALAHGPGAARPPARVRAEREQRVFHGRAAPVGLAPLVRRPHVDVEPPRNNASNSRRNSFSLSATARWRSVASCAFAALRPACAAAASWTAAVVGPPSQSFFRVGAGGDVVQGRGRARGLVSSAGSGYASSEACVLAAPRRRRRRRNRTCARMIGRISSSQWASRA